MTHVAAEDTEHEEQCEDDVTPPLPPDGGWGWVVVFASFICNILVDGVCFSFSFFFVEFLNYYGESKSKTAWVGSLVPGMYLGAGPLVSALANKYGCRPISMIGSFVAAVSIFLSTFSPNINWLIVTYGIMGGLGFGLMYLPSIVIVGYYFDKKRALATGIAVCGSGIGTIVFAPLATFLINEFGWKGANWIIAALVSHGILCGLVYRPLEATKPVKQQEKEPLTVKHGNIMSKIIAEKERVRTTSTGSLNNAIITTDNQVIKDQEKVKQIMEKYSQQNSTLHNSGSIPNLTSKILENGSLDNKYSSVDKEFATQSHTDLSDKGDSPVIDKPINWNIERLKIGAMPNRKYPESLGSDNKHLLQKQTNEMIKSKEQLHVRKRDVARPLYRADIFYSGSVTSIPEYIHNSKKNMNSYVNSVTSIPEPPEDPDTVQAKCAPLCNVITSMLDFTLLKSVTFVILCTASVLAMAGFFTPFVYLTDYALIQGVSMKKTTWLIQCIGIFNALGRIISGWLSDRPWADCLFIHNCALIIAGLATCSVPFIGNYAVIVAYCAIFGLCIAAYIALRSIVLVDLLGVQKLSNSFGLLLLFQGIASLIGSPLAGAMFDMTGSYRVSFLVSGGLIAIAGVICLPIRKIAKWENARNRDFRSAEGIGSQYSRANSNI